MILDASTLRDHLRFFAGAADRKAAVDIFRHVLWQPTESGARLAASDGQSFASVDLEGEDAGQAAAIPLEALQNVCRAAIGEMRLQVRPDRLVASWVNGRAETGCLEAWKFPSAPKVESWSPASHLIGAVRAVRWCAERASEDRLGVVLLWPDAKIPTAGAIDGVLAALSGTLDLDDARPVVVPSGPLGMLDWIVDECERAKMDEVSQRWIGFRSGERSMFTLTTDENPVRVDAGFRDSASRKHEAILRTNSREAARAFEIVAGLRVTIAGGTKNSPAVLSYENGRATVTAKGDTLFAEASFECELVEGEWSDWTCYPVHLPAVLGSIAETEINLCFAGPKKPLYFQTGTEYRAVAPVIY